MRKLMLLRHGKAHPAQPGAGDHDRPLADRGRLEAHRQGLAFLHGPEDALLISDAKRTQETGQALFDAWTHTPPHHITASGYLAEAHVWLDLIGMTGPDVQRLWVIGHNPGISDLVLQLTGEWVGMSTADLVRIELTVEDWSEVRAGSGRILGHHPGRNA